MEIARERGILCLLWHFDEGGVHCLVGPEDTANGRDS
jgi:hypothetical protein